MVRTFFKAKNSFLISELKAAFCEWWTSIKIKISMSMKLNKNWAGALATPKNWLHSSQYGKPCIYIYTYIYIYYIYIIYIHIYILYIYYIYIIYIHIYILWEGKKCFEKLIFYHDKNLTMNCLFYFVCIYNSSKLVSLVFI